MYPISVTDALGNILNLKRQPQRIISVVPSITEYLFYLDQGKYIVGRTKFCIHPKEQVGEIPKIGGTKNLRITDILSLKPDLIIANKEENTKEQIEELAQNIPVYVTNVQTISDGVKMVENIGTLFNKTEKAKELNSNIQSQLNLIKKQKYNKIRTAYLIWKKPYMSIGNDTFIHAMMDEVGFENIFADKVRYPQTSLEEIKNLKPKIIFLSSEPYPFKDKDIDEIKTQLPNSKIMLVDGEMFSWYGNKMLDGLKYLKKIRSDGFN